MSDIEQQEAQQPVLLAPAATVQMTQAQLQLIFTTAVAQALANAPVPAVTAAPAFHLVPGGGDPAKTWNFTSGDGLKLFQAATKGFDPRHEGDVEKLQCFLQ